MLIIEELVDKLMQLGLTQYQAQTYVALTRLSMASAPDISDHSKVPKAKIYDALVSLSEKGFVSISPGTPKMYQASPVKTVMNLLSDNFFKLANDVDKKLQELEPLKEEMPFASVWSLPSKKAVWNKLRAMALETKEVKLMVSPDMLSALEGPISEMGRKVKIVLSSEWKKKRLGLASIVTHTAESKKTVAGSLDKPHFFLIKDGQGLLICGPGSNDKISGAYLEIGMITKFLDMHFDMMWMALGGGMPTMPHGSMPPHPMPPHPMPHR